MNNQILEIYIPRMLGNVSQTLVKNSFHNLKIGRVFYIDMYKKINENGYPYYFAFIKLSLYDSNFANLVKNRVKTKKIMHLVYDKENNQYWELKQHIPREKRENNNYNLKNNSFYDETEKQRMIQEFEQLEKEIFSFCC